MARVDEFDAFYHAARRPLLHQTYALTGDVERAASAVEDAFAHTWSQWRKVRRLQDPISWVRNEAWRVTSSPLARPRRRGRGKTAARREFVREPARSKHTPDLQSLQDLPDAQRRAVVLHHLAELPVDRIAREIGISESAASSLLARGRHAWSDGGTSIGTALGNLEADVSGVRLTRAPTLRRSGEKQHRQQTLVGVVTAAALVVGGGLLIANDSPGRLQSTTSGDGVAGTDAVPGAGTSTGGDATGGGAPAPAEPALPVVPVNTPEAFLLDQEALLTATEAGGLTRQRDTWSVESTTDGTTGDPMYAPCQQDPFADPDGTQSLLRRYRVEGSHGRLSAVHVIEESRNERQAHGAFGAMESWYGRCADDGVHLMSTMAVGDLGDEARAFRLHEIGNRDTIHTVGIVRTGPVTTAVIASTQGPQAVSVREVLDRAAVSVTRMCLRVSGDCSSQPRVSAGSPLPTREDPGFLAAYDLPAVSSVTAPWVGTDPARSRDNPGATACERADFRPRQHPRTRVFVLPTANKLPKRFGLTETVGSFDTRADAREFVRRTFASAESCADRELSASRPRTRDVPGDRQGRVWRFEFEVNKDKSVFYRVGIVRSGLDVALVSMSPTDTHDVPARSFASLVERAGQRLSEAPPADRLSAAAPAERPSPTPHPKRR